MRRCAFLGFIVTFLMLFVAIPGVSAVEIPLNIDGWDVHPDVSPILRNGRTMVPVRFIAEEFGAEIKWRDPDILIIKDDFQLRLTLDSLEVYKNGSPMEGLDMAPFIERNRTMVPLRFIARALDVNIDYKDGVVSIVTPSFKEKKAGYYDMALHMRFDYLPEMSEGEYPDIASLLMYAYFTGGYYLHNDDMSREYVDLVAKNNFSMENVAHASTKEWAFDGDIYTPVGWGYHNDCFYDLAKERSFIKDSKTIYETVLDNYVFTEYLFSPMDFIPNFDETYSEPMMYVLSKYGNEIKNGMSTIDAIKDLIVKGDTANFIKGETLKISYYIDEESDNIIFIDMDKERH